MRFMLKILISVLIPIASYGTAAASEPLEIQYTEGERENEENSSSSYVIDNQRYLKEYHERRSGITAVPAPVTIITIDTSYCLPPEYRSRGIEYYNGSTMLRYFEGYPLNCLQHFHTVAPPRRHPPAREPRRHRRP